MTARHESPEGIAAKLHQVSVLCEQGSPVTEAVRQAGVPEKTYYRWRRQYGGMSEQEIRWIKQLMDESRWPTALMH